MPLSLASFVPPRPHCSDLIGTVSPIVSPLYTGQAEACYPNDISSNLVSELLDFLWSSRSSMFAGVPSFEKEIISRVCFFTKSAVVIHGTYFCGTGSVPLGFFFCLSIDSLCSTNPPKFQSRLVFFFEATFRRRWWLIALEITPHLTEFLAWKFDFRQDSLKIGARATHAKRTGDSSRNAVVRLPACELKR
jgi:hypothetical protein